MNRLLMILIVLVTVDFQSTAFSQSTNPNQSISKKTNFIIIMADDMGYGDPSCYGGKIKTPHLDKMAAEGMKFTDFHSSGTVCSPSRAGLMTGCYQQRSGIDGVITADPKCSAYNLGLDPTKKNSLPQIMTGSGYQTALFGKWHLGYLDKYNPMNYQFDKFVGFVSGNIDYISHYDRMGTYDWWHDRKKVEEDGYSTHLITNHAVQFIKKNKDNPFCIYIAHEAVHAPMQGPTDAIQRGPKRVKGKRRKNTIVFQDMLIELDKGVGDVIEAVKEAGVADNTLIIFTSDNGPMPFSSPGKLRGRKGSIFEGGHRVPTIAWWPGKIEPKSVTKETCIGIDLLPTLVDIAEIKLPKSHHFDGVSLRKVLSGGKLKSRQLFWRNSGLSPNAKSLLCKDSPKSIRDGKWKLVATPYYKKIMLFDLEADISERNDLAQQHSDRVKRMKDQLIAWEKEMLGFLPYKVVPKKKKN